MASVTFLTARITDWDSFHEECAAVFGFPDFYGANMEAWIDCLSSLPDDDGMSRFALGVGEQLLVRVPEFQAFAARVPEVCAAFLACTAIVNQRYVEVDDLPRLALVLA